MKTELLIVTELVPLRFWTTYGKNIPFMWEGGGGWSNTGVAVIIADRLGQKKKALHVRFGKRGREGNGEQALIPIQQGDHVVRVVRHNGNRLNKIIRIFKIESLDYERSLANCSLLWSSLNGSANGSADSSAPEALKNAIEACVEKSKCFHCSEPHYVM